jgi:hypothetical protein
VPYPVFDMPAIHGTCSLRWTHRQLRTRATFDAVTSFATAPADVDGLVAAARQLTRRTVQFWSGAPMTGQEMAWAPWFEEAWAMVTTRLVAVLRMTNRLPRGVRVHTWLPSVGLVHRLLGDLLAARGERR